MLYDLYRRNVCNYWNLARISGIICSFVISALFTKLRVYLHYYIRSVPSLEAKCIFLELFFQIPRKYRHKSCTHSKNC